MFCYSASTAQACLYLLQSTCVVYVTVSRHETDSLQNIMSKLVEIQSVLLTNIAGAGVNKKYVKAYRMVQFSNILF